MAKITATGINQGDLYNLLSDAVTLCNELKDDIDATAAAVDAVLDKLDADAGITDTNYGAKHGVGGSESTALPAAAVAADDLSLSQ